MSDLCNTIVVIGPLRSDRALVAPADDAWTARLVVLDTNVLLGLWLWRDPRLDGLQAALNGGQLRWVVDAPTWGEWLHEVRPARCAAQQRAPAEVLAGALGAAPLCWHGRPARDMAAPTGRLPLRCSDPDDQMFVDLALRSGARWLLTRDRALLRLRRPAAAMGLRVCNPDGLPLSHWASP